MWAGILRARAGDRLVGIGYDTDATATALRRGLARWLDDSIERDLPDAFGVRTAAVGWRRRRVGLVHHGTVVRYRAADLDGAVEAMASILAGMAAEPAPGHVFVEARAFRRGDQAVLVIHQAADDVDDRALAKAGVVEIPGWRVDVDVASGRLATPDGSARLVGAVVSDVMAGQTLDGSRRHLWAAADGDLAGWAEWLDRHGDLIGRIDHAEMVAAITARLG